MGTVDRRLGSQLTFDAEKEKDIIKCIDTLSDSKKLGRLISHLLRLAFESPEVYGGGREVISLIEKMGDMGVSPTRYNYFEQLSKEVKTMQKRVDDIYEMAYKTYMLAQMGKLLGSSERADNSLRASFILERQISDMCSKLGIDSLNHVFTSNKLEETHSRADKVLEHIIESYDSILAELKESLAIQVNGIMQSETKPTLPDNSIDGGISDDSNLQSKITSEQVEPDEEDLIDLTEKPTVQKEVVVNTPTGDRAAAMARMLKGI